MTSIRTIIASAAALKWPLYQMDVKNAFLNGDLSETVYMQPPPGIVTPAGHVCRLRRALYGLKQAPRAWFERFRQSLLAIGYTQSTADYAMFRRTTKAGIVILILYVDDMVITGSDSTAISSLKRHLQSEFEMKDLGFLRYFLGIEVAYSSRGYLLSQQKYISDILARATIHDPAISTSASCTTPMELHLKLRRDDGTPLPHPTRYRELVGSLIYLTATRPDISQAVQVLSQFMHAPTTAHYAALLRVLRYLRI